MRVDVTPTKGINAEIQLNALLAHAEPGTTLALHGEFVTFRQVICKLREGITINLDDAILYQPKVDETAHYSYPVLKIVYSKDISVVGGAIRGSNSEMADGVMRGLEANAGITIGGGSQNITVQGTAIREVWGDFVWLAGAPHPTHNEHISLESLECVGTGRHGISVRDAVGLNVGHCTFAKIRRLWFDHEPTGGNHFVGAIFHDNTSPAGGLAIWCQIRPVLKSVVSNICFRDHQLTKGNFVTRVTSGRTPRTGLVLQRLKRAPENISPEPNRKMITVSGWTEVVIEDVDGYPVAGA
jgi:hypothetical protein